MPSAPNDMQLVAANSAMTAQPIFIEAELRPEPKKRQARKRKAPVPKNFKRHLKPSPAAIELADAEGMPRSELNRLAQAVPAFKWKLGDAPLADAMAKAIRADRTLSPRQREDKLKRLTVDLKSAALAHHEALHAEAVAWVERVNAFEATEKVRKKEEAALKREYELGVQNYLRMFASWRDGAGDYRLKYEFTRDSRVWVNKNYEHQATSMARAHCPVSRRRRPISKRKG